MHEPAIPERPLAKEPEPDDPLALAGVLLPGDTADAMAECIVEEYVLQGFPDDRILRLFSQPFYGGTHAIYRARGEDHVKELIARVRGQFGQIRYRTEVTRA